MARTGKGDAGGYRQPSQSRKGIPNRIGRIAKENIIEVFELIGGTEGMVKWARRNRSLFYKLYARLIPTEIVGTLDLRDARQLTNEELLSIASAGLPRDAGETGGEPVPDQVH